MHQNRCYDSDVDHCKSNKCEIKPCLDKRVAGLIAHLLLPVDLSMINPPRVDLGPACLEFATRNHWRRVARAIARIWHRKVG